MTPLTKSWKKTIFKDDPTLKPESRIRQQVDGIERMLRLQFRARILDLGCGAGSQTIELARRRYRVLGMDGTSSMLAGAREKAKAESLTVHFVATDMRRIPYDGEFNAVINLRNPIGCFPRERDDQRCLDAVGRSLRRGGKLLLDLLNREWLIRRLGVRGKGEAGKESFDLSTGRLDNRGFTSRGGRPQHLANKMRIYTLTEIIRLLETAGLCFRSVHGGYDDKPYNVESLRMIVVAEKIKDSAAVRRAVHDGFERAVRIKGRPR